MLAIPDEIAAMVESGQFSVAIMIEADLDDGPQGLWSEHYDVEIEGLTFRGIGNSIRVDDFTGDNAMNVNNFTFDISGLQTNAREIIDGIGWHQRPATVFLAFLDKARNVQHQLPRYSGFIDQAPVSDASDVACVLSVVIENNNRDLDQASGRTRSDPDQRAVGGDDDEFGKYIAQSNTNTDMYWGRKGPQSPVR